jgi:hypothetical protein
MNLSQPKAQLEHNKSFTQLSSAEARLSSAQLSSAQLSSAQLSSAQLSSAQLSSAQLSSCLQRCNVQCAYTERPFWMGYKGRRVGEKEGTLTFIFYSSPCQQLCILNKLTKWGKDNTHFNFTEHIQKGRVSTALRFRI